MEILVQSEISVGRKNSIQPKQTPIFVKTSANEPEVEDEILVTPREKEVIHHLARGFTSREIGSQLGISFHTVESYRKSLLAKFNCNNTVTMVLKASNVLPKDFWIL
jgi:DNA-binding NarL/FixJ family response regulator